MPQPSADTHWASTMGKVVQGHRVASGMAGDERFPGGTLRLQIPHFRSRGLDVTPYFIGTINVSIAPAEYGVVKSKHTFYDVAWSADAPAEHFSFFDCRVDGNDGLVYYPHPETKPEHFQPPNVLEILTKRIDGLSYGQSVQVDLPVDQMVIIR